MADPFAQAEDFLDRALVFAGNAAEKYLDFEALKNNRDALQALREYNQLVAAGYSPAAARGATGTSPTGLNGNTALLIGAAGVAVVGIILLAR